jgi:hypothetical protein
MSTVSFFQTLWVAAMPYVLASIKALTCTPTDFAKAARL